MDWKLVLQIAGVVLGLLYLWLEYRADIRLWVVGLIMPLVHGALYYKAGLYADCSMQAYYVLAGLYIDPATGNIPEGSVAQAEQAFLNMKNLLEAAGTDISQVVKTTVFIKEMNDFGAINEVYAKYFTEPYPSRSCVEVARLPKDVMLEIEAIALK